MYTLPLILSGMLQLCFNAADTIIVGKFSGGDALAAVGSTGSLISLIINVFMGLAVGVSVTLSHAWGAGNHDSVRKIVHTAMLSSVIGGIAVMFIGFFGCRTFLTWMDSPANVIDLSTLYMRIYFLGMPACMVYNFGAAILRSICDTKRPMLFLTVAGAVNVVLNVITVVGFHMSVAGVAIATTASQIVSAVLVVRSLMQHPSSCRLVLREMRIYPDKLLSILRIGLPSGLQGSLFSISNVLIQSSVNSFGSVAMEGHAAASNLTGFIYTAMNSFYHTSLTFIGQNIGARKYHRIRRILFTCLILVTVVGVIMGALVYLFRVPLLSIYAEDPASSAEMIAFGSINITFVGLLYFFCGIMEVFTGALRALGASLIPMLISLVGACGTRIVWVYSVFAAAPTPEVLYACYPISWAFTILMQIVAFVILFRRFMRRTSTAP